MRNLCYCSAYNFTVAWTCNRKYTCFSYILTHAHQKSVDPILFMLHSYRYWIQNTFTKTFRHLNTFKFTFILYLLKMFHMLNAECYTSRTANSIQLRINKVKTHMKAHYESMFGILHVYHNNQYSIHRCDV